MGKKPKEVVASWAKNGTEPISKMEFRQHARKLIEKAEAREIDAVFDEMDADGGGTLDVDEMRDALKKFAREASDFVARSDVIKQQMSFFTQRKNNVQQALDAITALEDVNKATSTADLSIDARLGSLLKRKSMKASEIISRWDPNGDGEIDMHEFRTNVKSLGLQATNEEIDTLFRSLDEDGGGSLDMNEIKHALTNLQAAAVAADKTIKRLEKSKVNLEKNCASTLLRVQENLADDEAIAAEKEVQRLREIEEEEKRAAEAKEARRLAALQKAELEAKKQAEFQARINAKRVSLA